MRNTTHNLSLYALTVAVRHEKLWLERGGTNKRSRNERLLKIIMNKHTLVVLDYYGYILQRKDGNSNYINSACTLR